MDSSQILNSSLDDIIFRDRNKSYGAYYLRKIYSKHANTATGITLLIFLLAVSIPFLHELFNKPVTVKPKIATVATLAPPPPMEKTTPPPPQVKLPPPPKVPRFVPPVIVNTPPPEEETPPTQQEIEKTPPPTDVDPNAQYTIPTGNDQGSKVVDDSKNQVFTVVEQMPEFPGGEDAMNEFLKKHINYPEAAKRAGIEGKVVLSFVVDENGNISDIQFLRKIGGGCDEEAQRVVKAMPPWKPGKQNGNAVKVKFVLPISFELSSEE